MSDLELLWIFCAFQCLLWAYLHKYLTNKVKWTSSCVTLVCPTYWWSFLRHWLSLQLTWLPHTYTTHTYHMYMTWHWYPTHCLYKNATQGSTCMYISHVGYSGVWVMIIYWYTLSISSWSKWLTIYDRKLPTWPRKKASNRKLPVWKGWLCNSVKNDYTGYPFKPISKSR